jgi:hypothetical protein
MEDADAVIVTVACSSRPGFVVPSRQPRVLRKGVARWVLRRHNDLVFALDKPKFVESGAVIHASYVGRSRDSIQPAIDELKQMFENPQEPGIDPVREKAHAAFHLARAHAIYGEWEESRRWARICQEIDAAQTPPRHETVVALEAWATLLVDGFETGDWFVTEAIRRYPDLAELRFVRLSIDAPLCYSYGMNPGRYASQPQSCVGYLRHFPYAMSMIGIGTQVRVAESE